VDATPLSREARDEEIRATAAGLTYREVGAKHGISRQRVEQILRPTRQAARGSVAAALRAGTIVRPQACNGCSAAGPVEAHHDDYARPLDVAWLCRRCHRRLHTAAGGPDVPASEMSRIMAALGSRGGRAPRRNVGPTTQRTVAPATPPLAPGEARETTMPALLCRCARCAHEWAAWSRTIGAQPERPDRCPQCDARTWDQRVPRKAGRPKGTAEGARKTA
jgi:hypothetical protein